MDSEHTEFTTSFEHGRRLPRQDAFARMELEPQRQLIQNVTDRTFHPCKLLKAHDTITYLQHCAIYL